MFYIFQMNDGRWHISPLGGRPSAAIEYYSWILYLSGADKGFETEGEAKAALRQLTTGG